MLDDIRWDADSARIRTSAFAAGPATVTSSRPLGDVLVVETGEGVAVAFCGKLLADYGATVVKVELPDVDDEVRTTAPFAPPSRDGVPEAALHLFLNANKRSVRLDYGVPAGASLLARLVGAADVVTSFGGPGGRMAPVTNGPLQVGLRLSWFGQSGPWSGFAGDSYLAQHMGGMAFATAIRVADPALQPPVATPGHLAEMIGGLTGATAAMVALTERDLHGRAGDVIDVSITDAIASFMRQEIVTFTYGAGLMSRSSAARSPFAAPIFQQQTADGLVDLMVLQERPWRELMTVLGNPDWASNELFATHPLRSRYWDALEPLLQAELARVTTDYLYREGQARGVPVSPINSVAQASAAVQFAERGFFREARHAAMEDLRMPGPPFALGDDRAAPGPAPAIGAANEEVLGGWLGCSSTELATLREGGVV